MSRRRSHRRNMATRRPKFTAIDLAREQLPRQSFVSLSGAAPLARSFTPQRHLIGCAPWPAHYTGCQNTFSPSRNPPGTYRESPSAPPSSSLPSAVVGFIPALRALPAGQRVCVLVSQSGRPNEMHNGIVATRRASLREKRKTLSAPSRPPRVSRLQKKDPSTSGSGTTTTTTTTTTTLSW